MTGKLLLQAAAKFTVGILLVGLLLFVPAGTFRYPGAWLFMGSLFVPMLAAGIVLMAYALYAEVLRENTWLSRTVEVQEGQKVVDTGLYSIVRHPMYSATILQFLSMPLVLGSLISFFIFLAYPAIIVRRIYSEEQLLERELSGYAAYREKVRFRLIPFIW